MIQTILVPLDGSPGSESVLPAVGELAATHGARVRLLRVATPPAAVRIDGRVIAYADQEPARVELEELAYLRHAAAGLPGIEVERIVRFGEPTAEIVREAESSRVDLITMATHARTGIRRTVKGSVAETVEGATAIPVMLVRHGGRRAA